MNTPIFLEVDGRRARVLTDGDASNPPCLLLHGLGRSLEDWSEQTKTLLRGYRVISLDVPGFGYSDRMPGPVSLQSLANGVAEVIDKLGEKRRLHVVGNSLGGAIAQQLLVSRPLQVASLTMISSVGFGSEVSPLLRMLALPIIGPLATRWHSRAGATMMERALHANRSTATAERIDHALEIGSRPGAGQFLRETTLMLGTFRGVKARWRQDLADAVTQNPRPTLIVWGTEDRIVPAHQLAEARRVYPHAEVHLMQGVGHMPQIEHPEHLTRLVMSFLDRTSSTQDSTTSGNEEGSAQTFL
ncbi:alpha/beta fold hydrolase [Rhodococcus sp. WS4]|nr:alpha/beta fold hydrolase [Rhodococcus sp. WS4]